MRNSRCLQFGEYLQVARVPSLKSDELLAILLRPPLGYRIRRQRGSHRILDVQGRPTLVFAFHSGRSIPGWLVWSILTKQVGLTDAEARAVLTKGRS